MYIVWKWSDNSGPYYKSARPRVDDKKQYETSSQYGLEFSSQTNAINQSLNDNSFFSQDMNSNGSMSKREDIDNKMSDREMISQRGFNPFFQTNYVNDVVTRDMFLKPINTTQGKLKEKNDTKESNEITNYQ